MDHNRLVSSPPLNLYNLLIDVSYNLEVCTCTSRLPIENLDLNYLQSFFCLEKKLRNDKEANKDYYE